MKSRNLTLAAALFGVIFAILLGLGAVIGGLELLLFGANVLKVLSGALTPDSGRVTRAGAASLDQVVQTDTLDPEATVRAAVLGDLPEHVWAGDPRIRDVLDGDVALSLPSECSHGARS